MAKYDDLIDEASGELDRVEGQLHRAVQQLLDAQAQLSRATHDALSAERDKQKVLFWMCVQQQHPIFALAAFKVMCPCVFYDVTHSSLASGFVWRQVSIIMPSLMCGQAAQSAAQLCQ